MRFCVIMPLFNQHPALLERALASLLLQDYPRDLFHIRVFLDGPNQATRDALRSIYDRYGQAFTVHGAGRGNRGIAHTLNEAHAYLEAHRPGAYDAITWVSSDNLHYPEMLAGLARGFNAHLGYPVHYVVANNHRFDPDTHRIWDPLEETKNPAILGLRSELLVSRKSWVSYGLPPCFAYRAEYARLRYDSGMEFVEDLDFFVRLAFEAERAGAVGVRSQEHLFRYTAASANSHTSWLARNHATFIERMGRVYGRFASQWSGVLPVEWVDIEDADYTERSAGWDELPPSRRFVFLSCPEDMSTLDATKKFYADGRVFHGAFHRSARG